MEKQDIIFCAVVRKVSRMKTLANVLCLFYYYFQKSSRKKEKEKQTCKGCNESFHFTKRKHHCKSCGAVSTDGTREKIWQGLIGCRNEGNSGGQLENFFWTINCTRLCPSVGHLCKVFKDLGQQNEPSVPGVFRGQPQPGESRCR